MIRHYGLETSAILDMGDFIGGTLKYLRDHPLPRLTIAGGFGKLVKFSGANDLHSRGAARSISPRSPVTG